MVNINYWQIYPHIARTCKTLHGHVELILRDCINQENVINYSLVLDLNCANPRLKFWSHVGLRLEIYRQ